MNNEKGVTHLLPSKCLFQMAKVHQLGFHGSTYYKNSPQLIKTGNSPLLNCSYSLSRSYTLIPS